MREPTWRWNPIQFHLEKDSIHDTLVPSYFREGSNPTNTDRHLNEGTEPNDPEMWKP